MLPTVNSRFIYDCIRVCPNSKRKMTWAINSKLGSHISVARSRCVLTLRSKCQKPILKCATDVGMHVDMIVWGSSLYRPIDTLKTWKLLLYRNANPVGLLKTLKSYEIFTDYISGPDTATESDVCVCHPYNNFWTSWSSTKIFVVLICLDLV